MIKSPNSDKRNAFRKAEPYLNIGYTLIGSILFFGYVGYLVDKWTDLKPIFLIIGLFIGLFGGFYNMIKVIQKADRK
ncbi:MAG: AtpZ/AtpI family protein [Calditrichaceae bacterium]|jgi:ATP synthase protein I